MRSTLYLLDDLQKFVVQQDRDEEGPSNAEDRRR